MSRARTRIAVLVAAGLLAVAQQSARPGAEPTRKERLAALSEEDRRWLTEFVAPIILPQEEKVFLELNEEHQRERFKREFWARREKDNLQPPLGPGYQMRYTELRRLADEVYDGWTQEAGRMVLRYGEPADIHKADFCGTVFRDLEVWTYANSGPTSGRMQFLFYRPQSLMPRRLWTVGTSDNDVFVPGSCRKRFEDLFLDCPESSGVAKAADPCHGSSCSEACDIYRVWTQIKARQGSALGGLTEGARIYAPAQIPLEGIEGVRDMSPTVVDPKARTLGVTGPSGTAPAGTATAATAATPGVVKHKLTAKQMRALTEKLQKKYKDFLELVDLIIAEDERQVFLQISENYQKDSFIDAFWKRRSIDSSGLRTDYRAIHTHRVEMAKEQFRNLYSDRSKIFIISGPPDAVIPIDCPEVFVPLQIWYYERLEALKSKVYLIFYQPYGVGEYKLWMPLDGMNVLYVGGGGPGATGPGARATRIDVTRCFDWRTVQQAISYSQAALGSGPMSMIGVSKLFQPPTVETEGIDRILNMTTDAAAGAVAIAVTRLVRFPELRVNKIGVDLSLMLPRSELKARQLGEEQFYNVDVIGEVVKDERLIDNFKYRFDIPTDEVHADLIPVTVRRYLYPGTYKLVLKIADGNQNAEAHLTEKLTVPEEPDAPPPTVVAAREEGRLAIRKTADHVSLLPSAISILPIARELATGLQRFETKTAEGIRAVDFYLNGNKVMTRTRPPFDADLNLGPLPRKHTIRVVAYGPDGRSIGEDEYIVNEGK
ncbi:MAG: GWxTD domain-containing protein, partial [Thermoanaerobaculia bacterium]